MNGVSKVEHRVRLTQIDENIHMTNLAYYANAKDANYDLLIRALQSQPQFTSRYFAAFVAETTRFRRQFKFNESYIIESRFIYWDKLNSYMEQKFVNKKTGIVHCIMYKQFRLIHRGSFKGVKESELRKDTERDGFYSTDYYESTNDEYDNCYQCREKLPESFKTWMEFVRISKKEQSTTNLLQ